MINDILQYFLVFITSIGGGSFIILNVSKWCGNLLSEKLLMQANKKHEMEILNYQEKLGNYSKELEMLINQSAHVMTQQYDNEVAVYKEIWRCIHDLIKKMDIIETRDNIAASTPEEFLQKVGDSNDNFYVSISNLYDIMDSNAPFYQEDIYELLLVIAEQGKEIYSISRKYRNTYDKYSEEDFMLLHNKLIPEMKRNKDKILVKIRKYLISMRTQYIVNIDNDRI